MSNRETALAFIEHFSRGDIGAMETLMSEDLRFEGPFLEVGSRAEYLEALRQDPSPGCDYRILSITDSEEDVSVFYDLIKESGTLTVAQLFRFEDGLISEILVVFDSRLLT